jgi:hypothetical protein
MSDDPVVSPSPPLEPVPRILANHPPRASRVAADRLVLDAVKQLAPDTRIAFVPIFHVRSGQLAGNLAVVWQSDDEPDDRFRFKIAGYIGKDWGRPVAAGGAGILEWK